MKLIAPQHDHSAAATIAIPLVKENVATTTDTPFFRCHRHPRHFIIFRVLIIVILIVNDNMCHFGFESLYLLLYDIFLLHKLHIKALHLKLHFTDLLL
jgi:hypothetical protein